MKYLAIVALLALGACDTLKALVPSLQAKTPAQHVMALNVEYNGVFSLMKDYENLPRCAVVASKVCSEQGVVNKMRVINTSFDTQLASAWRIVKDASNSSSVQEAAVSALGTIVSDAKALYGSVANVIAEFKKESA